MTVIEFLDELINEYEIETNDPDIKTFQDVKDYIQDLEKENKTLKEIIEIKNNNYTIAREYTEKLKKRIKELKNGN